MESGIPVHSEEECTRGLERHVSREKRLREARIMEAVLAVLEEQALQRDEGVNDPELLADIYFSRCYQCGDDAYEAALCDREEIRSYVA